MGSRVPVQQQYNLRSANSFIGSPLHDLNTVDARPTDIDSISDVDRDAVTDDDDTLDHHSNAVVSTLLSPSSSIPFFLKYRKGVTELSLLFFKLKIIKLKMKKEY